MMTFKDKLLLYPYIGLVIIIGSFLCFDMFKLIVGSPEDKARIVSTVYPGYHQHNTKGTTMQTVKIKAERLELLPYYATEKAVGMDLKSSVNDHIYPGDTLTVPTGVYIELPDNMEAQIRSRSGLASKGIIVANSPGTIDPDYRGEIKVILLNVGKEIFYFYKEERIAQIVFAPYVQVELKVVKELSDTARGEGGLGHTGTK